jgi:hypothetical protein
VRELFFAREFRFGNGIRDLSESIAVVRCKPEPFLYESQMRFGAPRVQSRRGRTLVPRPMVGHPS